MMKPYRLSLITQSLLPHTDLADAAQPASRVISDHINWIRQHAITAGGECTDSIADLTIIPITYPQPSSLIEIRIDLSEKSSASDFRDLIWADVFSDLAPHAPPYAMSCVPQTVAHTKKRLIAFDFDSTLINEETIDELGRMLGLHGPISTITEQAMQGKITFKESFLSRCKLLNGLPMADASAIFDRLTPTEGAVDLLKFLRTASARTAVISGGFQFVLDAFQRTHGIDSALGNQLILNDNIITGDVRLPIIDAEAKRTRVIDLQQVNEYHNDQTVCVGDGANDIPMMKTCGTSVSFCGKPKLTAVCNTWILDRNLMWLKHLI